MSDFNQLERVVTEPGHVCMYASPASLCTVVQGGVSLTIYDKRRRCGGISHFLFPKRQRLQSSTGIFAGPALFKLKAMFLESGSQLRDLEAQVFGGATPPCANDETQKLAEDNIQASISWLQKEGIHLASLDVGGHRERKIIFNTTSGESLVAHTNIA